MGENNAGGMPSLSQCQSYASSYSLPLSKFFIDHDGTQAHANLFQSLYWYPDAQGMIGFPWNGVLDGATHEYIYADGPGPGADPRNFLDSYLP